MAPMTADATDTSIDVANAAMVFASKSLLKFATVKLPSADWKAPTMTMTVGASRKHAV